MEIKDLSPTERTALVALLRTSIVSDGVVTENEEVAYDFLVHLLGEESYRNAAQRANGRIQDEASLKSLLHEVDNQEARELIYGTLLQFASSETVDAAEDRLLELVGTTWNIKPQFEGFPSETE